MDNNHENGASYSTMNTMPGDMNYENAMIGAMIADGLCAPSVFAIVSDMNMLINEKNRIIFDAIKTLYNQKNAIDGLTISREIKRIGRDGDVDFGLLMEYAKPISSTPHVTEHAMMVVQSHILRRLLQKFTDAARDAMNEYDPYDIMMDVQGEFDSIMHQTDFGGAVSMATAIRECMPQIESAYKNRGKLSGVPTGLPMLDKMTNGWQPGDMIVLAGRPSHGKTALGLFSGLHSASCGVPTLFISVEMGQLPIIQRSIASRSTVSTSLIRSGDFEFGQIENAIGTLEKYPFHMSFTAKNIYKIRHEIIRQRKQNGIKLVIIDYLQLVESAGNSTVREREVADMSRTLKLLAGDLQIPIIVLAQVNRLNDTRGERPSLSSLRESGAIEQDADLVIFVHRPEKYGHSHNQDGESNENVCELIMAKQRNGVTGEIRAHTNRCMTKFSETPIENPTYPSGKIEMSKPAAEPYKHEPPPGKLVPYCEPEPENELPF